MHTGICETELFTSLTIVYSTVYSGADQRKHQSSVSLAFVRGIHRRPVNSPHKGPVTREMFPFDDVVLYHESMVDRIFNREGKRLFRVQLFEIHFDTKVLSVIGVYSVLCFFVSTT